MAVSLTIEAKPVRQADYSTIGKFEYENRWMRFD